MGTQSGVYKQPSIPIPEEAYINKKDRRVYVKVKILESDDDAEEEREKRTTKSENADDEETARVVIGRLDSIEKRTFNPNRAFGEMYPHLWKKYYGYDPTVPPEVSIGLYAALLGILSRLGLYDLLVHFYDTKIANAIIDYATCTIVTGKNAALKLEEFSSSNLFHFGDKPYDDSWTSKFLSNNLKHDTNELFKISWIKQCFNLKITETWLSIDGSNCDCDAKEVDEAKFSQNSKSGSGKPVIAYIWAVCAEGPFRGMPLAYEVNSGNMPDCKQQQTMATLLGENGINVKGTLFDRGFCDRKDIEELRSLGYDFVLMLRKDLHGYKRMFSQCAEEIHEHSKYMISTEGNLFGTTAKFKIFSRSSEESTIGLYYSTIAGCSRGNELRSKVAIAGQELINKLNELNLSQQEIGQGHDDGEKDGEKNGEPKVEVSLPPIQGDLKKYLSIFQSEDGSYHLECNCDLLDQDSGHLGYWSLASSLPLSAKELYDKYKLRDSSETQFAILKTQLGNDTMKGHSTKNNEGRFFIAFIASIIRSCFMQACTELGYSDVNLLVKELLKIKVKLGSDTKYYRPVRSYSDEQLAILSQFGVTREQLEELTARVTARYFRVDRQVKHVLPVIKKKKRGRPPKEKTGDEPPKKPRGRPRKEQPLEQKEVTNDANDAIGKETSADTVDFIRTEEDEKDVDVSAGIAANDEDTSEPTASVQDGIEYRNMKIQILPKKDIGRPPKEDNTAANTAQNDNTDMSSDTNSNSNDDAELITGKRGRKLGTPNRPKWERDADWPKAHRGRPTLAEISAKEKFLSLGFEERKELLKYFPDFKDLVEILNKSDEERLAKLGKMRSQSDEA